MFSKILQRRDREQTSAVNEWRQPTHLPDQRGLIKELFRDNHSWLIVLDAGRYDYFDQLYTEYLNGDLRRCWNGGVAYTGDWFERNLSERYPGRGLFSWLPLRDQDGAYDGREHFDAAPAIGGGGDAAARLAALGYTDGSIDDEYRAAPDAMNHEVRRHLDELRGGVVRYIKPHPPFNGLEDVTSTSEKTHRTQRALDTGDLTDAGLAAAYEDTYRTGFEAARRLIPDLDGRVVVTADHGTCLTCGQLYHGRYHEKHHHLTVVPWLEVEGVV